ncbi:VOC family protein [Estrella lausannensis]|uniref:VOC domain-containing protein n=1 Tax=Estrella lausannensis TaxID=483423 RepID=A0A0H5E393_9BACT|nr:VOC family protein [Estrella lausannensis]CRX37685.1 Conserved hypothetical protein [Estrella lausannensis]
MNNTIGISLCWIVVKDIEAAIKFYTETVGLKLKDYSPEFGWAELAGAEGSILGITKENPEFGSKAGTNAVVTITVESIEKAREEFLQKGVKLVGEIMEVPGHVKLQSFQDKDGNSFQLAEMLEGK